MADCEIGVAPVIEYGLSGGDEPNCTEKGVNHGRLIASYGCEHAGGV